MPTLPGANIPGGTLPNTTQTAPITIVPEFWNNFSFVHKRILEVWEQDKARAERMLEEFKRILENG